MSNTVIEGAPLVRTYKEVKKVIEAMWLLRVQTFGVRVIEDDGEHNHPRAQLLRQRLTEEKISHSGVSGFIEIHLPCRYYNPHNHQTILK